MANKRESVGAEGIYSVKWQCRSVRGGPVLTGGPRIAACAKQWVSEAMAGGNMRPASSISGTGSASLAGGGAVGSQQLLWSLGSALSWDAPWATGSAMAMPWQPWCSAEGTSWARGACPCGGRQSAWQSAGTSARTRTSPRHSGVLCLRWHPRALMARSKRD